MLNDLVIYALLFTAIAIGWWLGRRQSNSSSANTERGSNYYRGLNYLMDGRPDGAVDSFINSLEVNSDTLETHIALGNLMRKRGEVERAIRIHQNLLARPSLPRALIHRAHLELAKDYISAGLLDRAERLLLDLVAESPGQRYASRRHLLEIYQSEREWQQAIDVAKAMVARKSRRAGDLEGRGAQGQQVTVILAHCCCELAAEKLEANDFAASRSWLQEALQSDPQCVRASIALGETEYRAGNYKAALKALYKVRKQDVDYVAETIASLRLCHRQLNTESALRAYLDECMEAAPSASLVLAVAEDMHQWEGDEVAGEFLSNQLGERPSLRGLARLISMQMNVAEGAAKENLSLLQVLVERLLTERPSYRCGHCGFSGGHLHWSCPSCKYWGTIKTIRGVTPD